MYRLYAVVADYINAFVE